MTASVLIIDSTVTQCMIELLAPAGLAPSILDDASAEQRGSRELLRGDGILAFLGFGGDVIVGTLVIAMPAETAAAAARLALPAAVEMSPRIVGDWIGELSNQLLGRIKNAWLKRKVKLILTIPQTITCRNLVVLGNSGVSRRTYNVATVAGLMQVTFDCVLPPNFAFEDVQVTDDASEGDALLF